MGSFHSGMFSDYIVLIQLNCSTFINTLSQKIAPHPCHISSVLLTSLHHLSSSLPHLLTSPHFSSLLLTSPHFSSLLPTSPLHVKNQCLACIWLQNMLTGTALCIHNRCEEEHPIYTMRSSPYIQRGAPHIGKSPHSCVHIWGVNT